MKKDLYLYLCRENLVREIRERYNHSEGGKKAACEYYYNLRRVKTAKNIGGLFAIAKELQIGLGSMLRLSLSTIITDLKAEDFFEMPEKW